MQISDNNNFLETLSIKLLRKAHKISNDFISAKKVFTQNSNEKCAKIIIYISIIIQILAFPKNFEALLVPFFHINVPIFTIFTILTVFWKMEKSFRKIKKYRKIIVFLFKYMIYRAIKILHKKPYN